jgi:structural maintenance of chromosome 1
VQRHLLWRLYHITTEINESTRKVEEANEKLTGLRASAVSISKRRPYTYTDTQDQSDKKLKEAKKDHATASLDVKKREANVKKGEKALEDKKPEIVTVETQIAHSEKRVSDLSRVMERVQKDEDRQADSLKELEQGAADIGRRKDEAAGKPSF